MHHQAARKNGAVIEVYDNIGSFHVETANPSELNPTQMTLAQRVFGKDADLLINMKMLARQGVEGISMRVLAPWLVKKSIGVDYAKAYICGLKLQGKEQGESSLFTILRLDKEGYMRGVPVGAKETARAEVIPDAEVLPAGNGIRGLLPTPGALERRADDRFTNAFGIIRADLEGAYRSMTPDDAIALSVLGGRYLEEHVLQKRSKP